ncbi:hypothetical protein JCM10449v2_000228 [Rhodotorula kratochvilovae]
MADWSTTQMICPIAHLPNELLVEIVEHLEDPYSGRRSDLYNVCLVSKQIARVAQSILWRNVVLSGARARGSEHHPPGHAVALIRAATTAARAVKRLTLRYLAADVPLRLEALAAELPNVEHLRLHAVGRVDMTEVALFSNLSRLYIYSVDVSLSDPVFFPRLASLSFESAGLVSYLDSEWAFEAATLPALRHLRFECCRVSADEGPGWPYRIPHLPQPIVDQLESLQTDVGLLHSLSGRPLPRRSDSRQPLPTLFHAWPIFLKGDYVSSRTDVRNLQIARVGDGGARYIDRVFSAFPSLRLLLLPTPTPSIQPSIHKATADLNAVDLHAVEQRCRLHGVELRLYGPVGPLDGPVVPEFTAYLREDAAAAAGSEQ